MIFSFSVIQNLHHVTKLMSSHGQGVIQKLFGEKKGYSCIKLYLMYMYDLRSMDTDTCNKGCSCDYINIDHKEFLCDSGIIIQVLVIGNNALTLLLYACLLFMQSFPNHTQMHVITQLLIILQVWTDNERIWTKYFKSRKCQGDDIAGSLEHSCACGMWEYTLESCFQVLEVEIS